MGCRNTVNLRQVWFKTSNRGLPFTFPQVFCVCSQSVVVTVLHSVSDDALPSSLVACFLLAKDTDERCPTASYW